MALNSPIDSSVALRPAQALRTELADRKSAASKAAFETGMARAVEAIEKAHREGNTCVTILSVSSAVVDALTAAGYRVKFFRATLPADADSHQIDWCEPVNQDAPSP